MNTENNPRAARLKRWKAFLAAEHIDYVRGLPENEREDIFVLIMKSGAAEFAEYTVKVCIRDTVLVFEAALPLAVRNRAAAHEIINDLNVAHPVGLFQYDEARHEITWNHFLAFGSGLFPERRTISRTLRTADQMIMLAKEKLLSAVSEQEDGKREETCV